MLDVKRILDQLVGSGVAGGFAGGALASVLMGKQGRSLTGSALQVGGLALVGGLAWKAWQDYQRRGTGEGAVAPQPTHAFLPPANDVAATNALGLLLARAVISAAKADGQIDTRESQAILNQINTLGLAPEDKTFLFEEYGRPLDIESLARDVDTPEHAAEVYAASVLMIADASAAERIYLDALARALNLEPGLVRQIESTVSNGLR